MDRGIFCAALGIQCGDAVSIIGAGGKTSLMFQLAREARDAGMRVLVTTTTRILVPKPSEYDHLDLSGNLFGESPIARPGIYVGGLPDDQHGNKIRGVREDLLAWQQRTFDLVLIEADGAAGKPLKGWREDEPVIPDITSVTVGVLDIQVVGKLFDYVLVHRPQLFSQITGADPGDTIGLGHLVRLVAHDNGLFQRALGRECLYINKLESSAQREAGIQLRAQFDDLRVVLGSLKWGKIHG